MDVSRPNAPTPKRPGDPLGAPSTKEARASWVTEGPAVERNLRGFGFSSLDDRTIRLDVKQEDRGHAINRPLVGWPNFARLFGDTWGNTLEA